MQFLENSPTFSPVLPAISISRFEIHCTGISYTRMKIERMKLRKMIEFKSPNIFWTLDLTLNQCAECSGRVLLGPGPVNDGNWLVKVLTVIEISFRLNLICWANNAQKKECTNKFWIILICYYNDKRARVTEFLSRQVKHEKAES